MEVRERPGRWMPLDDRAKSTGFAPWHSRASHACIDREMPRVSIPPLAPFLDLIRSTERRCESQLARCTVLVRKKRCKYNEWPSDSRPPQCASFRDRGDAICIRIECFERFGHRLGAESVSVGLYHWYERDAGARLRCARVAHDRTDVDIHPRAIGSVDHWRVEAMPSSIPFTARNLAKREPHARQSHTQ